ncbi:MAG TPA: DUF4369 domain-containing protein, partial [Niabella sp.]|nr:DUF4369 domain-containing protein [Niabella sp.]
MKAIIKIVSIVTCSVATCGIWAQTNTRIAGKLKGLEAGTVIYLSSYFSPVKKDSIVASKGRFEFNLVLDEGNYYELKIGKPPLGPGTILKFYLEPGIVKIKGKASAVYDAKLSGSKFADEQNDLKKYIKNAEELKEYEQVNSDFLRAWNAKDSKRIAALRPKRREWFEAQTQLYRQWLLAHPSSPVSTMVLALEIDERNMEKLQEY